MFATIEHVQIGHTNVKAMTNVLLFIETTIVLLQIFSFHLFLTLKTRYNAAIKAKHQQEMLNCVTENNSYACIFHGLSLTLHNKRQSKHYEI